MNNKIVIVDQVLTNVECEQLIEYYQTAGHTHEWNGTFPMQIDLKDKYLKEKVSKIEKIAKTCFKKITIDWCEIVKWPTGAFQKPHYDSISKETSLTSITYLNDTYSNGRTYIVDDIKIVPKVGRTVFFDGKFYMHGVSGVMQGVRYTLPIWYKVK